MKMQVYHPGHGFPTDPKPEFRRDGIHSPQANSNGNDDSRQIFQLQKRNSDGLIIHHYKPFPHQEDNIGEDFKRLLCLADCRMANLLMFKSANRSDVPLAGRPYSPSTLKDWCAKNCRPRNVDYSPENAVMMRLKRWSPFGDPVYRPSPQFPVPFPHPNFYPEVLTYAGRTHASGVSYRSFNGIPNTGQRNAYIPERGGRINFDYSYRDTGRFGERRERKRKHNMDTDVYEEDEGEEDEQHDADEEADYKDEEEETDPSEVIRILKQVTKILSSDKFLSVLNKSGSCEAASPEQNATAAS